MTAVGAAGPRGRSQRSMRCFRGLKREAPVNNFGNQLSGGEQQMLAIGSRRSRLQSAGVLLLDEPNGGAGPDHRRGTAQGARHHHPCPAAPGSVIVEQESQKDF